jgi:hypothetical protein
MVICLIYCKMESILAAMTAWVIFSNYYVKPSFLGDKKYIFHSVIIISLSFCNCFV